MARETILTETTLEFADSGEGFYLWSGELSFPIENGTTYEILWDNVEYSCVAIVNENITTLGNLAITNSGEDTKEPFLISLTSTGVTIATSDVATSHAISIHKNKIENIVIKNPLGKSITYGEYDNIALMNSSGTKTYYSKLPEIDENDNGKVLGVANGMWQKIKAEFGGGGGGVSSWNDLTDKPFGESVEEKELFAETIFDFEYNNFIPYYSHLTIADTVESQNEIIKKTKLFDSDFVSATVVWDGTTYNVEAQYLDGQKCVGNAEILNGSDNGCPFVIFFTTENGIVMFGIYSVYDELMGTTEEVTNEDGTTTTITTYPTISHTMSVILNINNVKTLDEKYLPILNRTPSVETDILPLTEFGEFKYNANYGSYTYDTDPVYSLTIGETYIVNWDGVDYECVAADASAMLPGAIFIGNGSFAGFPSNNEPFAIGVVSGQGITYFAWTDTEAGNYHTVRIYQKTEESYTLKDEYQPDWEQIRNKPFGKTYMSETLIDGTYKYVYIDDDGDDTEGNGWWDMEQLIPITSDVHLVEGNTYTVTWDGTEYECKCGVIQGLPYVGSDPSIGEGDYPFAIAEDANGLFSGQPGFLYMMDASSFDYTLGEVPIDIKLAFSGLTTKKIDVEYLSQPNWNESDKSSAAYILNKPFGTIAAGTVVTEGTAMQPNEYGEILIEPIGLIVGASYIVELNGVSYTQTAEEYGNSVVLVIINTDEVLFVFAEMQGIGIIVCTQGEYTYKITLAEDAVQKIDAKYLPDNIGGGSSLPEVTTDDNDKVMKVVDGVWSVAQETKELPTVSTSDNDKVLKVVNGAWSAEIITHPVELPTVTDADNGKALVVSDGVWSTGVALPAVTTSDVGKFLRVSSYGTWAVEAIQDVSEVGL